MSMISRFTVRPKPKDGESLTGYILRVSKTNDIDHKYLFKYLGLNQKQEYILDILPSRIVNIDQLSLLFGININTLENMTFTSVYSKFYDDINDGLYRNRKCVSAEINKKERFFCPDCLKEKGFYQLVWQVKDIKICNKHLVQLKCRCSVCNAYQPYISKQMAYYRCFKCGSDLTATSKSINENFDISKQLNLYEEWEYLLNRETLLSQQFGELSVQSSIAISLLYASHMKVGESDFFDYSRIPVHTKLLLPMARDSRKEKCISLTGLKKCLDRLEISLIEFSRMHVPKVFINSVLLKHEEKTLGSCMSPWCLEYGSNRKMELIRKQNKQRNNSIPCICTGCYMKFGYTHSNSWEPLDNKINIIWDKVLPLLRIKTSRKDIAKLCKIDTRTVNNSIGYCMNHNLLPMYIHRRLIPKTLPDNVLESFQMLHGYKGSMEKNAKKYFGWSSSQYFFYLNLPQVQEYLVHTPKKKYHKKLNSKYMELLDKVNREVSYLLKSDLDITTKAISKRLGCSSALIFRYKLNSVINKKKEQQQIARKQCFQLMQQRVINEYVLSRQCEFITKRELYKIIGIPASTIEQGYPDLAEWIS